MTIPLPVESGILATVALALAAPVLAVTMPPAPPIVPTPPRPIAEPETATTCHLQGATCWSR